MKAKLAALTVPAILSSTINNSASKVPLVNSASSDLHKQ